MEARPGYKQPSDPIHSNTLAEREDSRKVQMVRESALPGPSGESGSGWPWGHCLMKNRAWRAARAVKARARPTESLSLVSEVHLWFKLRETCPSHKALVLLHPCAVARTRGARGTPSFLSVLSQSCPGPALLDHILGKVWAAQL